MNAAGRLSLPLGEAIFSQRAIRRLRPDPIPEADIEVILEAAGRAPSAANHQPWRFIVIRDSDRKQKLQAIYKEAWWSRRHPLGIHTPADIPADDHIAQAAQRLTEVIGTAPVLILVCCLPTPLPNECLTACQNLLLAARALGVGGTLTSLGGPADQPLRDLFGLPDDVTATFMVPLGYPVGRFGAARRKPVHEIAFSEGWDQPFPAR
ncbi:MAG: nitroreductase family protein [Chloroflexi bacterium]|nr:nitroreductase family protein [Chloroflexota bacterium]